MLKLKIAATSMALAGMMLLILGDTYMSAALAVICTAIATSLALHLTLKWVLPEESGFRKFLLAVCTFILMMAVISAIRRLGVYDIPLSTPIDPAQKISVAGAGVSLTGALSVVLATIAPWSPPKCDDED